jgi:hypothetical protein
VQAGAEGWGTAAYCRRALRLGREAAQRGVRSFELMAWALANGCPLETGGAVLPPLTVPHGTRAVAFAAFMYLRN